MATFAGPKKKQRAGSTIHLPELAAEEPSYKRQRSTTSLCYNDSATADVILRLVTESPAPPAEATSESFAKVDREIYLHSRVIERSKYFAALLSDRWQGGEESRSTVASDDSRSIYQLTLTAAPTRESVNQRLMVLQLLYVYDDSEMLAAIASVSAAIDLLPVALELLFEDCVRVCVGYLESVPWSAEEEIKVMNLIPYLNATECDELLARVTPLKPNLSEEMLDGLITSAIQNHQNMASGKAFVAKLLRDFPSRAVVRRVLGRAFEKILRLIQQSLEDYSSPDVRAGHVEMEALQRINLHSALINGKHLLWLVERMVDLKVADEALKTWSDQSALISDLQRVFREDAWKYIAPSLPSLIMRCTSRFVIALATGNIIANRQIRGKMVREWLPIFIKCKDSTPPFGPNHKALHLELEQAFLKIISTLPMSDSQGLLQQCLGFTARCFDDCPHLIDAFTAWFRRADANLPMKP